MTTDNRTNAPRLLDRVSVTLAALMAVLIAVEAFFAPHYRPVFLWHSVPGYMGAIGLFACLGVVWLSKRAGKLFLQRPEDDDDRV
jgi:Mn2+/Fe2+ NRAMP family transporter